MSPRSATEQPLLSVEDLSVSFATSKGLLRAVESVSLTLKRGRTLGIVGESGCGKSVLCLSLLKLLPSNVVISNGSRVMFEGQDLFALPEKDMRRIRGRKISVVLQDPMSSLHPLMKVSRQVAEPLIHHCAAHPGDALHRAVELLTSVGIPSPGKVAGQYPHQLSGGMRQRVAIAMALACNPRLIIADEPTTALDVTGQADILDLLSMLQQRHNMAMILVTHNLGLLTGRTHETVVMYAGRIVERAETQSLLARPKMPYTRALLDAMPRLDALPHTKLKSIPGKIPDPFTLSAGCSFATRCSKARPRCRDEEPPMVSDASGRHGFTCWYPEEGTS